MKGKSVRFGMEWSVYTCEVTAALLVLASSEVERFHMP